MSVCVNVWRYQSTVCQLQVNDLLLKFQFAYQIIFCAKRVCVSCANCFILIDEGSDDSDKTSDDLSVPFRAPIILLTIWYWSNLLADMLSYVFGSSKVNCHTVVCVPELHVHQLRNTVLTTTTHNNILFLYCHIFS